MKHLNKPIFSLVFSYMDIYLVRNKLLFPAKTKKLNTGNLLPYYMIDPIRGISSLSRVSENQIARHRWWWRYIRLCLELEQQKVSVSGVKIRVDRSYYRMWDLEELLSVPFNNWWKAHENLFFDGSVEFLDKFEMGKIAKGYLRANNDDYHFLKVPKTMKRSVVLEQVKNQLEHRLFRRPKDFEFKGKSIPMIRHHILFNCLVMSFNGASREKIINWCNYQYRGVEGAIQTKKDKHGLAIDKVFSFKQSVSRVLSKSKRNLLAICKGHFA
tara:strand:- start:68 stop:877 length:810 start_codon:yes stop_codon:yes gene_type:complete